MLYDMCSVQEEQKTFMFFLHLGHLMIRNKERPHLYLRERCRLLSWLCRAEQTRARALFPQGERAGNKRNSIETIPFQRVIDVSVV